MQTRSCTTRNSNQKLRIKHNQDEGEKLDDNLLLTLASVSEKRQKVKVLSPVQSEKLALAASTLKFGSDKLRAEREVAAMNHRYFSEHDMVPSVVRQVYSPSAISCQ